MAVKVTPTRANLIKSKSKLAFSTKGYNLLDKKRTVLIQEIMKLVQEANEIEDQITVTFNQAYQALQQCCIAMGLNNVEEYALSIPDEEEYQVRTRSVMGVDIPEVVLPDNPNPYYSQPLGFNDNNPALDQAIEKFNQVKFLSYKLSVVESTAFKLSQEIKKASKSANALNKIQIPKLTETISYIEDSIEEKDREEHFRIKKVKKHNQARELAERKRIKAEAAAAAAAAEQQAGEEAEEAAERTISRPSSITDRPSD
ncbi:MAG: V-type ATP synthase subunit D [Eubacteriaceae bacterium]|jgi:V/A-type H+-transporting ATPase subunit D